VEPEIWAVLLTEKLEKSFLWLSFYILPQNPNITLPFMELGAWNFSWEKGKTRYISPTMPQFRLTLHLMLLLLG